MCAVFFALGYGSRVLQEGGNRYEFGRPPELPPASASGRQPEAAPLPIQPLCASGIAASSSTSSICGGGFTAWEQSPTMADTLRQKGFAVLVLEPTADNYYRVEVGPYPDAQSAHLAKLALNREGFQVIVRRY